MKLKIALLIGISFVLLSACNRQPQEITPVETTANATQDATVPAVTEEYPQVEQQPMFALSMPVYAQRIANGDLKLFEYIYQDIHLVMPEEEIAERITIDFLNRTDVAQQAEQLARWAQDDYFEGYPDWVEYQCRATYTPTRFDEAVLSMLGTHVEYGGLNMSQYSIQAVNYDMTTGKVLSLSAVLTNISRDELCNLIIKELDSQKQDLELYDDFADTVTDRFSGSIANEKNWYFSGSDLCFFFAPYEIAPNAAGTVTVQIPYSDLAGKMDDAFFPPELESGIGKPEIMAFTDANTENFDQFAELFMDGSDGNLLLYTNTSITDVCLELLQDVDASTSYVPSYTMFTTPHMTPGDALNLQYRTEDLNRLRLRYCSGDQYYYAYFTLDQTTNTVLLTD